MIRVAINGACGRMGSEIILLALEDKELRVAAALEYHAHPQIGADIGAALGRGTLGLAVSHTLAAEADVLIDFTDPAASMEALWICQDRKMAMVIGTTGHTTEQKASIEDVAETIPIVLAPNMSVGVTVLFELVRRAAQLLDERYDVEIIEAHHRFKKDAPSGTAKGLVEAIVDGRKSEGAKVVYGRAGAVGERGQGEIGVHAVRAGDIVGDHTVMFARTGERVELTHRAHSRQGFARGAIRAAKFVFGKRPGLYTMRDVLGIEG